ncbi:MAG: hypothetical protein WC196_05995 [Bacilli bacterium]|jgi:hypothetical protein
MVDKLQPKIVTIYLASDANFKGFDCRGRDKAMCDGCRLRFLCLSERDAITVPLELIKEHNITNVPSLVDYMFGEGRVSYTITKHTNPTTKETKPVMRL